MSFIRIIISVLIATGLWILCGVLIPAGGGRGKYIVLVCDEAVVDREIRGRLEARGITGAVSESGQYVFLDCFDGIEQIPLGEYFTRILPFDPRNDGYADKLRSLFVRDGKRYIYIPRAGAQEKKIMQAMGDIPCSVEYPGSSGGRLPAIPAAALFCLVLGTFFLVRPLRRTLRPLAFHLIPCMPALAPLALGGVRGFTLAALLSGAAVAIAGFCQPGRPRRRKLGLSWLLPAALAACYALCACFSGLPLLVVLLVPVVFGGVLALSLRRKTPARFFRNFSFRRAALNHRYFSPVTILMQKTAAFDFASAMLPFAAAALVLSFTDISAVPSLPADLAFLNSPDTITEADYYNHVYFQSTFSHRSLNAPSVDVSVDGVPGMPSYELAPDGLPVQIGNSYAQAFDAAPVFPLARLLRELNAAERGGNGFHSDTAEQYPLQYTSLFRWLFLTPWLFIAPAVVYWLRPRKRRKYVF